MSVLEEAPGKRWAQYMTPEWAALELVERYFRDLSQADVVLEPSCGTGAFLKAIPESIEAIGVEIDPALARVAEENTGRRILVGDFRIMTLDVAPTVILGNPPFDVRVIEQFLSRAAQVLPPEGRCGFLLPAYAMQTHRRVWMWHQVWAMTAEIIPRRLFPRLRLPLLFVQFQKARVRTLVGFALVQECVEFDNLAESAKEVLVQGQPRKGVWRALVEETLRAVGGQASLETLYRAIEPRRPTPNAWWREKIRQVVQLYCHPIERGVWALKEA